MSEIPKIDFEKTRSDIVEFIKSKVNEANSDGIAIGLSGGIDSTLVAYLACDALGSENVFGIIMPSATTPAEDKIHGIEIAQNLGIEYKEIAIDSILNEFLERYGDTKKGIWYCLYRKGRRFQKRQIRN